MSKNTFMYEPCVWTDRTLDWFSVKHIVSIGYIERQSKPSGTKRYCIIGNKLCVLPYIAVFGPDCEDVIMLTWRNFYGNTVQIWYIIVEIYVFWERHLWCCVEQTDIDLQYLHTLVDGNVLVAVLVNAIQSIWKCNWNDLVGDWQKLRLSIWQNAVGQDLQCLHEVDRGFR